MTNPHRTIETFQDHLKACIGSKSASYGYGKPLHKLLKVDAPYTFTTLANGSILPLNRLYKPLGVVETKWVEYEDFADQAWPASELNLAAAPIQSRNNGGPGHCEAYLYRDSNTQWLSASDKHRYLSALKDVLDPTYKPNLEN